MLGLLIHRKGVRFDKKAFSPENLIPVDYNSIDGSLFPAEPAGVELVKDYAIWGMPGWMVKQETLKKYPLSRLKKMKTEQVTNILFDLMDKITYKGFAKLDEKDAEERHELPDFGYTRCQLIANLNIPVVSAEARSRVLAGTIPKCDLSKSRQTTIYNQRTSLMFSILNDGIAHNSAQGGISRQGGPSISEDDWYKPSMITNEGGYHAMQGLDLVALTEKDNIEWKEKYQELLRQEIVEDFGKNWTPYTDKQKKQAWAEMIESGLVWTDLYQWEIVPVTRREDYNPPAK